MLRYTNIPDLTQREGIKETKIKFSLDISETEATK
jgi:hypothetical protein